MWLGNPSEPTGQPVKAGYLNDGFPRNEPLILPPAWRVEAHFNESPKSDEYLRHLGEGAGQSMHAVVTSDPLGQRQLIRFFRSKHESLFYGPDSPYLHIPTGGAFSLSFGSQHVRSVPYNVTRPELESYIETMAAHAGIHDVQVTATRTEQNHLRILLQHHDDSGFQFPRLDILHNVTCGGCLYPEQKGEFVMFRRLNYFNLPHAIPEGASPESAPHFDEWAQSPFLWNESSTIWFRSERHAGDQETSAFQFHPQFWQFGYQLQVAHDPFDGDRIYSTGWVLMMHVERQHWGGDWITGITWPMSLADEAEFVANRPVRLGPKTFWPSPNSILEGMEDSRVHYDELPQYLWIYPDWG